MKKILALTSAMLLAATLSVKADIGIGLTGSLNKFSTTGTETTRTSGQENPGSLDNEVVIPELFIEAIADNGFTVGLAYVPTSELGNKSRSDANVDGDTGTYKAKAELSNAIQIYTDLPLISLGSFPFHAKVGVQHVKVETGESLNAGSKYGDQNIYGLTLGLGTKGDIPYGNNLYYKAEVTYTNFETVRLKSDAINKVKAYFDATAAKISIGYKF